MKFRNTAAVALLLAAAVLSTGCDSTATTPTSRPVDPTASAEKSTPAVTTTTLPSRENPAAEKLPPNVTVVLPPIPKNSSATVPPEMLEALKALSAEDYKARQEAVAKLQLAMGKHFQQMVLVQEMMIRIQTNLAEQLKQMTLTQDPESNAKVASLMEFNSALCRWAIEVMAMPDDKRQAMIDWGVKQENLSLISRAYARKTETRAEAAKELAKLTNETANVDWMLQQLLNDEDREVSLKTMDAIWDRPMTPEMVDALWNRASAYAMNQIRPRQQKVRMVTVRGRSIQIYEQDQSYNRAQDGDVATDLLIKSKAPVISDRLNAIFIDMAAVVTNPNDSRWRSLISTNYGGDGAKSMIRLIEAYKPKEAIPFLIKAVNGPVQDGYDTTVGNNEKVRYSSRIDAAAMLLSVTGQDLDDYNLRKYSGWGDRWLLKGTVTEENELIKKVNAWWRLNAKNYGQEPPPEPKAETQPAKPKADPDPAAKAADAEKAAKEAEAKKAIDEDAANRPPIVRPRVRIKPATTQP